jgi:hypothetical protein
MNKFSCEVSKVDDDNSADIHCGIQEMVEEAGKSKLVLLSNPGDCLHLGLV